MRKPKQLCCIDLRVHLCQEAQKCTSLCRTCKHQCDPGKEYAERFLGGHRAPTESKESRTEILVKAYIKKKQDGLLVSQVLHIVNPIGITTTSELRDAWSTHRAEMVCFAETHGLSEYFTARGRLSPAQRAQAYQNRLKNYATWLAEGLTWKDIAQQKEFISESAVYARYKVAKAFMEEWEMTHSTKNGMYCY